MDLIFNFCKSAPPGFVYVEDTIKSSYDYFRCTDTGAKQLNEDLLVMFTRYNLARATRHMGLKKLSLVWLHSATYIAINGNTGISAMFRYMTLVNTYSTMWTTDQELHQKECNEDCVFYIF